MIQPGDLTNRLVAPAARIRVLREFRYGGRDRKPGEEFEVPLSEASLFSTQGLARTILGTRRELRKIAE